MEEESWVLWFSQLYRENIGPYPDKLQDCSFCVCLFFLLFFLVHCWVLSTTLNKIDWDFSGTWYFRSWINQIWQKQPSPQLAFTVWMFSLKFDIFNANRSLMLMSSSTVWLPVGWSADLGSKGRRTARLPVLQILSRVLRFYLNMCRICLQGSALQLFGVFNLVADHRRLY